MSIKTIHQFALIFFFLLSSNVYYAQIKVSDTPDWVVQQSYDKSPEIDLKDISYGLLVLLSDEQVHVPKQERYIRFARKITDNVGVQDGSSISINFDPTYQQLVLHNITVFRNGTTIDKLNVNDFQTIRQESNAESYIYDGSLNAIANLADIRNGDILDVSYSIKGFNPIHGNHFSGATALNDFQPVGKINYYIISNKTLKFKTLNSNAVPDIGSYMGYTTYHWQTNLAEKPTFEDNSPMWYLPYDHLFVSDYKTWGAVVDWALKIYKDDLKLSSSLKAKIEQLKNSSEIEGERILATLKFVQDDIRYLGLESGIGAYKPFSPNQVLEQRFGDCKDKSWLMVTMLRQMGIEAYPVLISSVYGESLDQFLPSPNAFDHVVVNVVDSKNNSLFYDPTLNNQFGYYKSVSFPNYGKGLIIKENGTALEKIKPQSEDTVEVFDIFDLPTVGGPGTLKVMTLYRGAEADAMRRRYKSNSISSLSDNFKDYYENLYDGVEVLEDPTFDDDSLANKLIVEEFYKINDIWKPMVGNDKNIAVDFTPYSILDVFISPNEKTRKTPFDLYYPTHKKHNVTIKLPESWRLEKDNINITSKNFDFSMASKMSTARDILYLDYEYKNKHSHVAPKDFEDYYNKVKEVEQILSYYIYIPKSEASNRRLNEAFDTDKIVSNLSTIFYWIFGIVLIIAIGLVVFVVQSNKNREK
ncbi:DUF3857 domain-containing transglutaminase family protein [Winogradskyella flava]|uniref:DUF3857 domain-containing transglutaminase family protein n=1 Tax=Winogradskyella flava TaxID=1884876 RepID=A0A842IPG2_9FLAO|nr:DUF3857 domain-containing transglutaminase family protein [Winogradskyella flava]MBC2845112.1 DUF3857 domain-containing transglutaminase family protein [Winogradskyella flava]